MTGKNLWEVPKAEGAIRTPTIALKEQTPFLSKMTEGILEAYVSRSTYAYRNAIEVRLRVRASILDYSIEILELSHGLYDLYPCEVASSINSLKGEVNSEEELMEIVARILQSEEMKKILSTLLREAQSGND